MGEEMYNQTDDFENILLVCLPDKEHAFDSCENNLWCHEQMNIFNI